MKLKIEILGSLTALKNRWKWGIKVYQNNWLVFHLTLNRKENSARRTKMDYINIRIYNSGEEKINLSTISV